MFESLSLVEVVSECFDDWNGGRFNLLAGKEEILIVFRGETSSTLDYYEKPPFLYFSSSLYLLYKLPMSDVQSAKEVDEGQISASTWNEEMMGPGA